MSDYYDDDDYDEVIEGYCVRCRLMIEIDYPEAVWTRRGMAATRGECPDCGGTVFRMGKTHLHDGANAPAPVSVGGGKGKQAKLPQETVYVLYAEADEAIAQQIAADLEKVGVSPWLHESDEVMWAGGVHPALKQCQRMIYVLSPAALAGSIEAGWQFFKTNRKPVIIAQIASSNPPDALRRSPRFDFATDYKRAFREMLQALG